MFSNQFLLLSKRRFLPLFITQFLGAFNDNFYKNALVVFITYQIAESLAFQPQVLVALAGGLLIVPMFLFSAQAGMLADKFEKSKMIRWVKFAEILLMFAGAIGFITQNVTFLMCVLFLIGTQATFFGPLKYSILPVQLNKDELVAGNALIEMGTFLAVLLGYIISVILIALPHGLTIIAAMILLMAILGFVSSCYIPPAAPSSPDLKLSFNVIKETVHIVNYTRKKPDIFLCILGISWFWLLGFSFLTLFPGYAKEVIGGNEQVFVLFLATFSIGIAIGSSFCNRLLKGSIEATFVPLAALGMSLFTFDLYWATQSDLNLTHTEPLLTPFQFLQYGHHWRILIDMLLISICAGIYIVPLYAMMQYRAADTHKSRVIASNNIMNALFMTVAAVVTMILFKMHVTIPQIFIILALINLLVVYQSCRLLPGAFVRSILRTLLHFLYDVEVKGLDHFHNAGDRVVITPNHTSYLDGLLLAAFLPGKISFAMFSGYVNKWWIKPVHFFADIFGVDPTNPYILKTMVKYVESNKKLVIFPEGRITVTGTLMKIYEGPGLVADKSGATILPVLIEGAQYTHFSRLKNKVKLRWFPKITLTIFEPRKFEIASDIRARKRRQLISEMLYNTMSAILFLGDNINVTLFESLLDAKKIHGGNHTVSEDIQRQPVTYNRLILGSIIIGNKIAKMTQTGEVVGILLPNILGNVVTFFGLQAYRRVAALLNFSTGTHNVVRACYTAKIKRVITAHAFVEKGKYHEMIAALKENGITVDYLEDIRSQINIFDKIFAIIAKTYPGLFGLIPKQNQYQYNKPAVILFTSGSEGNPKAVVLSGRNIQANKSQLASRMDFSPRDIVLNALPMFHSFGLTAGTLLPIFYGMKVFLYPSPLHYRVIPELSYDINATIIFGTNTFLAGYARHAKPYDFYSIRYVFAGAEKLKEDVRRIWADKFGVRIFEGYGTTEASPVIAANTPMHNKPGTVGQLMPGMEYKLEPVENMPEGGRFSIKGPNIMLGYMFYENPGAIIAPELGWYDTGDIVSVDEEGYISIQGRAKRFAKIAGEMISLLFVENYLDQLWPESKHAVINIPDEKKGEQLVMFTTQPDAEKTIILQYIKEHGISELTVPKTIHIVKEIPLLGSGKVDYAALTKML